MISFDGVNYYIDLAAIDELIGAEESLQAKEVSDHEIKVFRDADGKITGSEEFTRTYMKSKEVDGAKYETINFMLQIVMSEAEPMDDTLGSERAFNSMPFNYKMAFNTLKKFGVIKAEDAE